MKYLFFAFLIIAFVFRQWFSPGYIAAGDLWPAAKQTIEGISLWPTAWSSVLGGGLGASSIPYLWNYFQYALPLVLLGKILHLPWEYIVRFGYLFPFLFLSIYSSYNLAKRYLDAKFAWLSSVIYTTNTYILMVIAGGQTGVAMAYTFAPYVLAKFMQPAKLKDSLINGLFLALLIAFDLRIAYLTVGAIVLYYACFSLGKIRNLIIPLILSGFLHLYWILPTVLYRGAVTDLGSTYTNAGMLRFLSFADFSHAIALLHPNWPENLFGKVYFLQPEFLLIPILAFISLLFARKNKHIYYFVLLAIVGAFMVKGVQEPLGGIFQWLFNYFPGFMLFRDPTKFYLFLSIGYCVLIPFTLIQLTKKLNSKLVYILFLFFWLFTIRQAATGQIRGTLQSVAVQGDYRLLEKMQIQATDFSRTFWIPGVHRFSFTSSYHPALDALTVTGEASIAGILNWISKPEAEGQLNRWAIANVIVPIDTEGEFFATDRRYDAAKREETIRVLEKIPWLVKDERFKELAVFELVEAKKHYWFEENQLIFSENYNPYWVLTSNGRKIFAGKTSDGLNQFSLPQGYQGPVKIEFVPQQATNVGLIIGVITLITCLIVLVIL